MFFNHNGQKLFIHNALANSLNSLAYNVRDDWDFVVIITGDRSVRVGKSILAMTVCAYLAYILNVLGKKTKYDIDDIYFDNKEMISSVQDKPPYSINHYDEGREGLAANKAMQSFQQDLLDFFAECGQLNHIWVIVCPDFFELKETISVARSEFLINVYRKEQNVTRDIFHDGNPVPIVKLVRGQFEFFNRRRKQVLYDIARSKHQKNYGLVKANYLGVFTNQYTVDKEAYISKKKESLARFQKRHEDAKEDKQQKWLDRYAHYYKTKGFSHADIVKQVEAIFKKIYTEKWVGDAFKKVEALNKKIEEETEKEDELIEESVIRDPLGAMKIPKKKSEWSKMGDNLPALLRAKLKKEEESRNSAVSEPQIRVTPQ